MNAHVHIGAIEVFNFALMLIITGFILRQIEYHFPDTAMGKALATIY